MTSISPIFMPSLPLRSITRIPGGKGEGEGHRILAEDGQGKVEGFDEVVFACDAEAVLKILNAPTWSV